MKILCLFVRFGENHHAGSLDVLNAWYERHGLLPVRTLWILDNALPADTPRRAIADRQWLRAGDNSAWEFSAWDRALREAVAENVEFDLVHFVTSSFNTLYTRYLEHFRCEMLEYVLAQDVCLGHIDSHPVGFELEGRNFTAWIRSCFFMLPGSVARNLTRLAVFRDAAVFFVSSAGREFRSDAPLSETYQKHLKAWLQGEEIGGHAWHSPVRGLTGEHVRFQSKVLAILNEHQLSISLRSAGVRLTDFCWLNSVAEAAPAGIPAPAPEADQLKVRRRILGIPEEHG